MSRHVHPAIALTVTLALALVLAAPGALAQGTAGSTAVAAGSAASAAAGPESSPAPSNAIEIDAARRFDLTPGGTPQTYTRITYLGQLLTARGTPLKQAASLDLLAPALPASAAASSAAAGTGDRRQWTLRYENREARLGGSLLEGEGVQPIRLEALGALDLRGTAAIATDQAGTRAAVGLETRPFRLPGFAGHEVSNWLVLGLNGQRDPAAGGGGANDRALVTYRAFAGKGFGWRPSADVSVSSARVEAEILKLAPNYKAALQLRGKINEAAQGATEPTAAQARLLLAIEQAEGDLEEEKEEAAKAAAVAAPAASAAPGGAGAGNAPKKRARGTARTKASEDAKKRASAATATTAVAAAAADAGADRIWLEAVRTAARDIADAQDTRPTLALYGEASGWYTARGQADNQRRQRNLFTATLDWWLVPTRDDMFLRLRYEDGYEWTAPTRRKQQVSVSITVRL